MTLIDAAIAAHQSGALDEAEHAYRRILAADPLHVDARHYLGVLLHQTGQSASGIALIVEALQDEPGSAPRYNDLGNILTQTGDLDAAAEMFRAALAIDEANATVWNNLGAVLQRQRNVAEAEAAYHRALRCAPDYGPALHNLAGLLSDAGRNEEASLFACRAFVLPPLADKPPKMLAIAYYRLGRIAEAAECYRAWLEADPGNAVARHYLAACTGREVPALASEEFIITLFDEMADGFDAKLVGQLAYKGPQIIAELLGGYSREDVALDILDGGCGTGLCAEVLAPYARSLTGVDLSSGMLMKARERGRYSELICTELVGYLRRRQRAFDLIVMADTLIYFGDLIPVLESAATALRPGGSIAFTVETMEESSGVIADYRLGPSGRYAHHRRYVDDALRGLGYAVRVRSDAVLRNEFCQPIHGMGVFAQIA